MTFGAVSTLSNKQNSRLAFQGVIRFVKFLFRRASTAFAVCAVGVFVVVGLFAPVIAPFDPLSQNLLRINTTPSYEHWLGTDQFGRDVLSRLIGGTRNSMLFGFLPPLFAAVAGTVIGVTAGYFGGLVDRVLSRIIDTMLSFPELLLAIVIAAVLGGGFWNVILVITVAFTPAFARVARASTLSLRNEAYVDAARCLGLSAPVIIMRHIVPNILAPIVVLMTLWMATSIRLEAALSFLGLGTLPPNPSWGNIIKDGLNNIFGSPWPVIAAGLFITVVVLSFSLIGDALRDYLDPDLQS